MKSIDCTRVFRDLSTIQEANIPNFILAVGFKIKKSNKVFNLEI